MKVAVPLFGRDVAPRFGFAEEFLIADIDREGETGARRVRIAGTGWPARLEELQRLEVDAIVCGGFNRRFVPLAESCGMRVLAGVVGDAQEAIASLARGDPPGAYDRGEPGWLCENGPGRRRGQRERK
jgi:predicted Fe-Mo cluster-binding NifX family protein